MKWSNPMSMITANAVMEKDPRVPDHRMHMSQVSNELFKLGSILCYDPGVEGGCYTSHWTWAP